MEMTKYSMWTKRRRGLAAPHLKPGSIYDDSWEEQAFAEDAAGALGGCIWPPRSYSCSFCRREFRSAQALGGHMNVHRRDRARLKQSPIPHNEVLHSDHQNNHNNLIETSFSPFGFRYQSHQVYNALLYSPNPNSDPGALLSSNSPPACGVSSDPPQDGNHTKKISIYPFSSSIVNDENPRKVSISSPVEPRLVVEDYCHVGRPMSRPQMLNKDHRVKPDHLVGTDLPTRLNLFVQTMPTQETAEKDEERCSKKRKIEDMSRTTFFLRSNGVVRDRFRPLEVEEQSPSPKEELDLELRLGSPPKVKLQN